VQIGHFCVLRFRRLGPLGRAAGRPWPLRPLGGGMPGAGPV